MIDFAKITLVDKTSQNLKLNYSMFIVIIIIIFSITITLYVTAASIVNRTILNLEHQTIKNDLNRVVEALNNELDRVDILARDYARVENLASFSLAEFPKKLNQEIFLNLKVNLLGVLDENNHLLSAIQYNPENQQIKVINVEDKLLDNLQKNSKKNICQNTQIKPNNCFFASSIGMFVYAIRPFTRLKETEEKIKGMLLVASLIEDNDLKKLGKITTGIDFSIKPLSSAEIIKDNQKLINKILSEENGWLDSTDNNLKIGYSLLKNVYNEPIAIIRVTNNRDYYQSAQLSLTTLKLSIFTLSFLFVIVCCKFLKDLQKQITERNKIQGEFTEQQELAHTTFNSIADGIIVTDKQGKIKGLNPVAERLTGWQNHQAVGQILERVYQVYQGRGLDIAKETQGAIIDEDDSTTQITGNKVLINRLGEKYPIYELISPLKENEQVKGSVIVFRDVTKTRQMAHQLAWQATYDPLTNLINRNGFEKRLKKALTQVKDSDCSHCLCVIDLDHFKYVNETCGHLAGDELLRQLSQLFTQIVPSDYTLARLGADEFGVIFFNCSLGDALTIAKLLCEATKDFRFYWQNQLFCVGASIGLVAINKEAITTEALMAEADLACYGAKENGRGRVYVSSHENISPQRLDLQWVAKIHQALTENRFCLFYQPIVSLKNYNPKAQHYEVLLRLTDEQGNFLSPGSFLPAAERYNLMPSLDRWVIEKLFSTQSEYYQTMWSRSCAEGFECLYTINLSGSSLNDQQFIEFLHDVLQKYLIPPQVICFEITETVAITNINKTITFIEQLKALGCKFALDDFGTGMSSFNYLKKMPVDYLKIDGSFIEEIIEDEIACSMVQAINEIAHLMGIKTIAEFVKDKKILNKTIQLDIDYVQGYFIGKPQPLKSV